jgi:outer membrane lipoprotein-sorting protein
MLGNLRGNSLLEAGRCVAKLTLLAVVAGGWGCALKRTVHVSPPQAVAPPKQASVAELVRDVDAWSDRINTLVATVDFKPTTGSIYSGVIQEYHDVHGFILLKKPSMIRIIGQAPVVGTEIFDMVSDAAEFRLYIPSKNKFIVGKTAYQAPAQNALENLRPQHILSAVLISPIDQATEKFFVEETQTPAHQYYILTVVKPTKTGGLDLSRKVWFDRSDLEISQVALYGPGGALLEGVHYAEYRNFQQIEYPAEITVDRPADGYTLSISIASAKFNQPIPPEKFVLKKPPSATQVELGAAQ